MDFSAKSLIVQLEESTDSDLDAFDFGVVKLNREGHVIAYNAYESKAAGLSCTRVLGRHFFNQIGTCMNNALVAERFVKEEELDTELDYLITFRMKPSTVRLRLLKSTHATAMYLLVRR